MDLQTAATRLGVHYQTAYRWVREGSLRAVKHGSSYEIDDADLETFRAQREAPTPPPKRANVRSWDHHVARLYEHLVAGDELAARAAVDRLREGGIDPLTLCEELFAPALRRVGDEWARGAVSVAVEHRASAICDRLLARVAVHPRGRPRGVAVVATSVGEEHAIPACMAALALRHDRWQVHHLGTQVPTPDLLDLVRALDADVVVIANTNPSAIASSDTVASVVRASTKAEVLVGGPGESLRSLIELARSVSAGGVRTSRG
ncbi:MAG TPA: B12-binding domain-containing protein [Acidimicrobiales bacterium]